MTDIPDEAVEAAFDAVGMRIKVLPEGSPATGRDVCYEAIKAALPYIDTPQAVTIVENVALQRRIKELEDAMLEVISAQENGPLRQATLHDPNMEQMRRRLRALLFKVDTDD